MKRSKILMLSASVLALGLAFGSNASFHKAPATTLADITLFDKPNSCAAVTCGAYPAPNPLCTIFFDDSPNCSVQHVGTERQKP
jgi:hypothetical protein